MRRWRNLIILVVVLGLLGGSLVYLNNKPKNQQDNSTDSEVVEISKVDSKKIVKMELESKNGTLILEKKNDKWIVPSDPDIKLNETAVNDLVSSFATLNAEKVVEKNPGDVTQYGLNPPAVTAKATLDDNSQKIFLLGDKVPGSSMYYLMAQGKSELYAVWVNHGEHFAYVLSDIRDKSLPEINAQEFKYLLVKPRDGKVLEITENEGQSQDEQDFGINAYVLVQPYDTPRGAHTTNLQDLISSISNLTISGFEDRNPESLEKYGLDKPKYEIVVKDKTNTLSLLIGNDKDDNNVYFKTPDSKEVYSMSKDSIDKLITTDPFFLVDRLVSLVNIEALDRMTIEYGGNKVEFNLSRTTKKAEKEGEEDEVVTTYKMNGKEVEEDTFKKFYQNVIGVAVDGENDKDIVGKPDLKVTFTLNRGIKKQMVMEYIPYNADFYGAVKDGKAEFVVSKAQIQNLINTVDLMRKGEFKPE